MSAYLVVATERNSVFCAKIDLFQLSGRSLQNTPSGVDRSRMTNTFDRECFSVNFVWVFFVAEWYRLHFWAEHSQCLLLCKFNVLNLVAWNLQEYILCHIFCHPWLIHTQGRVLEGPARKSKQINFRTRFCVACMCDRFVPLWGVLSIGWNRIFLSVLFRNIFVPHWGMSFIGLTERNSVSRYITCFCPPVGHVSLFGFYRSISVKIAYNCTVYHE